MIGDLFFLIKSLFLTVIVVIVLQVKLGDRTLEQRTHNWITSSNLGAHLTETAQGIVYFTSRLFKNVRGTMNEKFTELLDKENTPGLRTLKFNAERSGEYLKQKIQQARDGVSSSFSNDSKSENGEAVEPADRGSSED